MLTHHLYTLSKPVNPMFCASAGDILHHKVTILFRNFKIYNALFCLIVLYCLLKNFKRAIVGLYHLLYVTLQCEIFNHLILFFL